MRRNRSILQLLLLLILCIGKAQAQTGEQDSMLVQPRLETSNRRLIQRLPEPADPLVPWSLESQVRGVTGALTIPSTAMPELVVPDDSLALELEIPEGLAGDSLESQEMILVVRCRQILLPRSENVARLEKLLQAGRDLEQAKSSLGLSDLQQRTREYAVDELAPEIAEEIAALPDSGWSRARPWRGRSMLFQVLKREERPRETLPSLGAGLDEQEQRRIADLLRQRRPEAPVEPRPMAETELQPAAVVEQTPAEYPPSATEDGEVNLVVEVGRLDQVISVRVESSTDPIFEEAAIQAARASTYRAARRASTQIAEPGSVRLTYRFRVPQAGNP